MSSATRFQRGVRTMRAVLFKELVDALRDRRTMMMVMVSSVFLGPLLLVAISGLIAASEQRAERREIYISGIEHSPLLRNFLERQTYTIKAAPADYETQLHTSKLGDPVVVVPPDFERALLHGDWPVLELVSDASNQRASAASGRIKELLKGFSRERANVSLALRGVAPELLDPIQVEDHDLARPQTQAAQFTTMLPFFVIMAVLYGALNAALDTTAGERERGSLEPLLMNPAEHLALVLGKWGAVACVSMLIALLSCLSFFPAQWLLRSETLQATFHFGLRETAAFLAVLLPLAATLSAVLMAVAIRCKTIKEAQASSTLVALTVSLLPLLVQLNQSGEAPWHLWLPALAQNTLMTRVLKGEALAAAQILIPFLVCVLLTTPCVFFVSRRLRTAAIK